MRWHQFWRSSIGEELQIKNFVKAEWKCFEVEATNRAPLPPHLELPIVVLANEHCSTDQAFVPLAFAFALRAAAGLGKSTTFEEVSMAPSPVVIPSFLSA